jgi:site-specific DNA-methyltransferase (adenine-specific)
MDTNILYYGDNLKILRDIPANSIDLVYLDPPFNSNASYNVLFKEPTGKSSDAQITAFEDTWHWGNESELTLLDINNSKLISPKTKDLMNLLTSFLGRNDMMAYLAMMCPRLAELKRVLKDEGAIFLHCDATASHYLKTLMDAIFGINNFRNDIIWNRSLNPKGSQHAARTFSVFTDNILFYSKTDKFILHLDQVQPQLLPHELEIKYDRTDDIGSYTDGPVLRSKSMGDRPNLVYEYKGYTPDSSGWRLEKGKLEELDRQGNLGWSATGKPFRKLRPESDKGSHIGNLWNDISLLNPQAKERLGYPTQKPEALLERIIQSSSNDGDIVLDPFCGCGTAIVAAQKLSRKWIGIDITHLAIGVMKWRLAKMFPGIKYSVKGEPVDLESARKLANDNKYEFQWWAVSKIGGQPYGDKKKGADTGIDGYLYFTDYSTDKDKVKKAIISVKAGGQVHSSMIRDLGHVIDREKADFGIFITLEKPTEPMVKESATKGFYNAQSGHPYPRIQILTIEGILHGDKPNIPMWVAPIQLPPMAVKVEGKTKRML